MPFDCWNLLGGRDTVLGDRLPEAWNDLFAAFKDVFVRSSVREWTDDMRGDACAFARCLMNVAGLQPDCNSDCDMASYAETRVRLHKLFTAVEDVIVAMKAHNSQLKELTPTKVEAAFEALAELSDKIHEAGRPVKRARTQ